MKSSIASIQPFISQWDPPGSFAFPLSKEDVLRIHDASIAVLSRAGFSFSSEKVLKLFRDHGFRTEADKVFFNEKQVLTALETVPNTFSILARNKKHTIPMEPGHYSFGLGRGAVNIVDPDGSYHLGTKKDLILATKLTQCIPLLEHWNPLVYPVDVEPENLHLWLTKTAIEYTDKPYLYVNRHDIDLIALAYETSREQMEKRSDLSKSFGRGTAIITSPLSMTDENCENFIEYAQCGIAMHPASMPIAGTSGPCTLSGTITLQNSENLALIVLSQVVRSGCPIFYGAIGGRADMQTLRPRFGVPEARLIERAGAQMARYYSLSCRGGVGLTDAPSTDYQAGAQAMLSTISVLENGPNYLPACGLLGSYIGASLAKIILDVELIKQVKRFLGPVQIDNSLTDVELIDEIGPGNNYIQHIHTFEHYRDEFLTESIFPSPDYDGWSHAGKPLVVYSAHEEALKIIDSYEKPSMDPDLEKEIDAHVSANWIS